VTASCLWLSSCVERSTSNPEWSSIQDCKYSACVRRSVVNILMFTHCFGIIKIGLQAKLSDLWATFLSKLKSSKRIRMISMYVFQQDRKSAGRTWIHYFRIRSSPFWNSEYFYLSLAALIKTLMSYSQKRVALQFNERSFHCYYYWRTLTYVLIVNFSLYFLLFYLFIRNWLLS
jgi:hypothetical protein